MPSPKRKGPYVSVLIPCYNVEKFLRQCMDSVVNQTLKDIEIICINDGSTDSTLEILKEYASYDSRIKIINKPNSGYGDSMNAGLDLASSDYVGIVESDDFIEPDMFEKLYTTAKVNDLDIARCQYFLYTSKDDENILCDTSYITKNTVYRPLDEVETFYQPPAIWTNLVKKSLIKDNGIFFLPTPGASYQDTSFAFKLYAMSERFGMIEDVLLHYRIDNEASSINSVNTKEKAYCVIKECAEIRRFAKEKGLYHHLKKVICKMKYATYIWNYKKLSGRLKAGFLIKVAKEFICDVLAGNVDKNLLSDYERKRLIKAIFRFLVSIRLKG
ncbi:glycosyltransferase [Helicobacter sp. 11S02629-2]|uniref:glycosyltransferase n=1 Tax=Helicobacter sp. 11S02629-2 TaxID=1476195 RepID=UPI000BA69CA3|nr:glycosyltransferase [Helicobacter sp. 11S02629-2]PAF45319.1 hypothetical protein BKH40_03775 [Helicobacter sp. 11S02629-2]